MDRDKKNNGIDTIKKNEKKKDIEEVEIHPDADRCQN